MFTRRSRKPRAAFVGGPRQRVATSKSLRLEPLETRCLMAAAPFVGPLPLSFVPRSDSLWPIATTIPWDRHRMPSSLAPTTPAPIATPTPTSPSPISIPVSDDLGSPSPTTADLSSEQSAAAAINAFGWELYQELQ